VIRLYSIALDFRLDHLSSFNSLTGWSTRHGLLLI
jgi:hypothetical protein